MKDSLSYLQQWKEAIHRSYDSIFGALKDKTFKKKKLEEKLTSYNEKFHVSVK